MNLKDEFNTAEGDAMNYEGSPVKIALATLKPSVQPMAVSLSSSKIPAPPVV